MKFSRAALALALAALAASPLLAQEAAKDPEADVRRLAAQVGEIAGKQQGVLDRMDLLRRRLRLDQMLLDRVKREEAAARAAAEASTARLAEITVQENSARKYLRQRMRQLYALGILQEYRLLFAASTTQDLRAASFYLAALGYRDAEAFKRLSGIRAEQARVTQEAEAARSRLEMQAAEAARETETLTAEQARLSATLAQLGQAKDSAQRALEETLAASKTMDRYVSDLNYRRRVEMMTKDMGRSRGQLPAPCDGSVLRGFGLLRHAGVLRADPREALEGLRVPVAERGEVEARGAQVLGGARGE